MKVYTVSDIHVDYPENMDWVLSLSDKDYQEDLLILAGDVSHELADLAKVFASLTKKFRAVHFIPGNHELWIEDNLYHSSLEKFEAVQSLCAELKVETKACNYGDLSVVPLFAWYDFSFGTPDKHLSRAWRDFRACKWPEKFKNSEDINSYFLELNNSNLSITNEVVISYSHFLPRIDVMPSYIPKDRRRVYPVLGSESLGEQVSTLSPNVHIYGHSHVNQSIEFGSTRFINNAFAYPAEQRIARKELYCVWDMTKKVIRK